MSPDELLERLTKAAEDVKKAEQATEVARRARDQAIRAALEVGLGTTVVANYAGVTRQTVYNVVSRS